MEDRSPHPGVRIVSTEPGFEAWFRDARTGRRERVRFEEIGITTELGRIAWAKESSRFLKAAREAPTLGEIFPVPLAQAVSEFDAARAAVVSKSTREIYREYLGEFAAWCAGEGIETSAEITARDLESFRDYVVSRKKTVPGPGMGPGGRRSTERPRSPATQNLLLACVKVFLKKCWRLDALEGLDLELIRDRLRSVREPRDVPEFLRPGAIRRVLAAALDLDRARGPGWPERRRKNPPIAPFTLLLILGGFRAAEGRHLTWSEVDLAAGEIRLTGKKTKTGRSRTVTLAVSPSLVELLAELEGRFGEGPHVFGGGLALTSKQILGARRLMIRRFGAPPFLWRTLRRTCGTFLTCAPAIFGGASAFLSAKRLGHTVRIAEKHYAGALAGIPREARTLEAAMEIEDLAAEIVGRLRSP